MPFQVGQPGNPGGRPKALKAVEEAARAHTEEAIATLAAISKNEDAPDAARIAAAVALLIGPGAKHGSRPNRSIRVSS